MDQTYTTQETDSHTESRQAHDVLGPANQQAARKLAEAMEIHREVLFAYARILCRTQADAWDLFQDTLERALRRPPDLSLVNARAWLLRVMRNLHTDRCRLARRRRSVELTDDLPVFAPDDTGRDEPAWLATDASDIRACLTRIDPRLRDAYVLRTENGLSLSAIAERLGIAKTTAGTRIFRARRQLQRLLRDARVPQRGRTHLP